MNSFTKIFLVLLRLAIGWHFLVEGFEKIQSVDLVGPTTRNRPWSSAGFLRESSGTFAPFFRQQAGDPDLAAIERIRVPGLVDNWRAWNLPGDLARIKSERLGSGPNPNKGTRPGELIPPALEKDWREYFDRFAKHYDIPDDDDHKTQRGRVEAAFEQAKDEVVLWMMGGAWEAEKTFQGTTARLQVTVPDRLQEYVTKLKEIQDIEANRIPAFGKDVSGAKFRTLKADLAKFRTDLMDDLDKPLKEALDNTLEPEQAKKGSPPVPELTGWRKYANRDALVRFGLFAVGACLLLGLFSRLSCVLGAAFLLTLVLAMPALPTLPENIKTEGHYLFVNKNMIEMLALLALATTRSGCWFGLDGLVQFLNPRRWRSRAETPPNGQPHGKAPAYATR